MRRLVTAACLSLAIVVLLVAGLGAGGSGDGYLVRAIFDDVGFAVPDEDVKIAGAKVGVIESMDVTEDKKAAVTLRIEDERFTPFRTNAHCTVRPQSLIGEKFVECQPGTTAGAPLVEIEEGPGKGEHLLPVLQTSSPVDLDLVNNTLRLPYRERLAIILNEFGTGLAGRGKDLNEVIHRANPALRELDDTLSILARQNRVLARLAVDSDVVLAPLAREKRHVTHFIETANTTGEATAQQRGNIAAGVQRLPRFLRELRGLMADLEGLTDQATPVTADLGAAAPGLNRFVKDLGPFSELALPSIKSLGETAETGLPDLLRTQPLVEDLIPLGNDLRPLSVDLDNLTRSLDKTDGIERAMDFFFYGMTAINGFDSAGHYLRASLVANTCSVYQTTLTAGCGANFVGSSSSAAPRLASLPKPLRPDESKQTPPLLQNLVPPAENPAAVRERKLMIQRLRRQANQGSHRSPGLPAGSPALNYLLEDGG